MITIEYSPLGIAVPDHKAEDFVLEAIKFEKDINVSTENIIYAARALIVREQIKVQFKFEGEIITPNKHAKIEYYPQDLVIILNIGYVIC